MHYAIVTHPSINTRPFASNAGPSNIQERMLQDKTDNLQRSQNMNLVNPWNRDPVPLSMVLLPDNNFGNLYNQWYGNLKQDQGTDLNKRRGKARSKGKSMNSKYTSSRLGEQNKIAMQTSMDYGYSSYSSEESQNGMREYGESMNFASCIDDDEVFYLEMSDEKEKARHVGKWNECEFGHDVPTTPRHVLTFESPNHIQNYLSNGERIVRLGSPQLTAITHSTRTVRFDNIGCDIPTCQCLDSKGSVMRDKFEQEVSSGYNDTPMSHSKLVHDIKSSITVFSGIQSGSFQNEIVAMHSDSDADHYDDVLCNSNPLEKRGHEIVEAKSSTCSVSKIPYKPENSAEYAIDVYLWKCSIEDSFQTKDILILQNDVTAEMRHKLLAWLVLVNRQFQFSLETWCLMVNILDRFLSIQALDKDCLQLVGLTAFFIAAKQEEVDPPEVSELVSLCARGYEARQFLMMERLILALLNFKLMAPTLNFFVFYLVELETSHQSELENHETLVESAIENEKQWPMELTRKLIERTLCEERLARIPYSLLGHSLFDFLVKHFNMNCYDEIDACANDEMFVDSYFKMFNIDILDQYEDDDL